jgi:hypothetical protein
MFEMASVNQVRAVLLEEAILKLLRASGYRTVTTAAADPTLFAGPAGLNVWGRGGKHQIDAIADLRIGQPFSNPQRLIVEAKAYSNERKVGLPVVRGAVGVLKDVSEFWVKNGPDQPAASRYHYQFAIFSTSEFTGDAQDYAFAHDVHLLPLRRSSFFSPVVRAIENAAEEIPIRRGAEVNIELSHVRHALRERLQPNIHAEGDYDFPWLTAVVNATQEVGASLIAMLGMSIPVFLTPRRDLDLNALPPTTRVQLHFGSQGSWTITRSDTGQPIFTFDLPAELFELYAENGDLTRRAALNLKEDVFGQFTAIYSPQDSIRVFNFILDQEWVTQVRQDLGRRRRA